MTDHFYGSASAVVFATSTTTPPTATQVRQVTRGDWEVRRTHGVDPTDTWIFFSSTATSADRAGSVSRPCRRHRSSAALDDRRAPSGVPQPVAHSPSRFVERYHHAAAGPHSQHECVSSGARCRAESCPEPDRAGTVDARAAAGSDPRRVRDGSVDDQAAGFRPRRDAIPSTSSRMRVPTRHRSPTRGVERTFSTISCSPSAASSCGFATTAPPAARA